MHGLNLSVDRHGMPTEKKRLGTPSLCPPETDPGVGLIKFGRMVRLGKHWKALLGWQLATMLILKAQNFIC